MKDILRSKIAPPRLRRATIARDRLLTRLDQGVGGRLILVCAPAGYGKSTLVADWIAARQDAFYKAWLSLDPEDNDANRFVAYMEAALERATPQLRETLRESVWGKEGNESGEPGIGGAALTRLMNALGELDRPLLVVMDDYHHISNFGIHKLLLAWLTHLPETVTMVIVTRVDPPLPLARLQSQGTMVSIRAADLRFDVEEAGAFLDTVMGLRLAVEQITTLAVRTEGWVSGLQLAALSLQQAGDVQGFLEEFAGDNHNIRSYLMDEALAGQPAEVQQFLLATSVLERLCAPLCEAVLEDSKEYDGAQEEKERGLAAQEILEYLEQNNLFITPLDEHCQWYRYHTLFGELLRFQLWRDQQESVAVYQRRAARWLEEHGLHKEARRSGAASDGHAFAGGRRARFYVTRIGQMAVDDAAEALSEREMEVLELLAEDFSYHEIAERLFISLPTVKTHVAHIYGKFGVHSREDALNKGAALGLLR